MELDGWSSSKGNVALFGQRATSWVGIKSLLRRRLESCHAYGLGDVWVDRGDKDVIVVVLVISVTAWTMDGTFFGGVLGGSCSWLKVLSHTSAA